MNLQELMRRAGMWRGGELPPLATRPSGFAALDAILPGGGWPRAGLTEILSAASGIGALRLVTPLLAAASSEGGWIVWIDPPYAPYAPALHARGINLDRMLIVDLPTAAVRGSRHGQNGASDGADEILWACEQALRFADCAVALMWLDAATADLPLRRLQLAAEAGATCGIVFRPATCAARPSPALLRLALEAGATNAQEAPAELDVRLLKARGPYRGAGCRLVV
ncbi:MAG: translesion DNA synthesis-associated protein ImuA [Gammaproteobacteria bacterium]